RHCRSPVSVSRGASPASVRGVEYLRTSSLVAQNVGVAIVPALTARSAAQAGIAFRPLGRPTIFRGFFFLRARNRMLSPASAALAERILAEISKLREDEDIRVGHGLRIAELEGPASASRSS